MNIGVFCGTFNPIHLGHLLIAECARDQFSLDKVIFVTSPCPPHRSDELLDGWSRHELVKAAVSDNQFFEASSIELERQGPSYTLETLKQLDTTYEGKANLNLIIGGDNLGHLKDWYKIEELFSLCRILVVPRLRYLNEDDGHLRMIGEETTLPQIDYPEASIEFVDFPGIAVSGSRIRERIKDNKTILYMVPLKVNELIKEHGHFRTQIESSAGNKD